MVAERASDPRQARQAPQLVRRRRYVGAATVAQEVLLALPPDVGTSSSSTSRVAELSSSLTRRVRRSLSARASGSLQSGSRSARAFDTMPAGESLQLFGQQQAPCKTSRRFGRALKHSYIAADRREDFNNNARGIKEAADEVLQWQRYLCSEEYETFSSLSSLLESLPDLEDVANYRVEFETLAGLLHRMGVVIGVEHISKAYRSQYSPDVQLTGYLYSTLLTAFTLLPSYVLNGEEFYVSDTVLAQCRSLRSVFGETCQTLKRCFKSLQSYTLHQIRNDLRRCLVYFDSSWCRFELPALEELEAIHRQACRPLLEAIQAEKEYSEASGGGMAQMGTRRLRHEVPRNRLLESICELNRVANIEGKGRSDMDASCLVEAERLVSKPVCTCCTAPSSPLDNVDRGQEPSVAGAPCECCSTGAASPPVLYRVAHTLLRHFFRLRKVLQRYSRCLYQLNSHLANNWDLVEALESFETAWESANRFLVDPAHRHLAMSAYRIVTSIREPTFRENLENLEPVALMSTVPRAFLIHEFGRMLATQTASIGSQVTFKLEDSNIKICAIAEAFMDAESAASFQELAITSRHLTQADVAVVQSKLLSNDDISFVDRGPSASSQANVGSPQGGAFLVRYGTGRGSSSSNLNNHNHNNNLPRTASSHGPGPLPSTASRALGTSCGRLSTADMPPATPSPPRMAVPNGSRPPTSIVKPLSGLVASAPGQSPVMRRESRTAQAASTVLVLPSTVPENEDDPSFKDSPGQDDYEEDDGGAQTLSFDLAAMMQANCQILPINRSNSWQMMNSSASTVQAKVLSDKAHLIDKVVTTISSLSISLQRAKPQEWNELIQVVLQSMLLVKKRQECQTRCPNHTRTCS